MKTAWENLLNLLPKRISAEIKEYAWENLQELRLRSGSEVELNYADKRVLLSVPVTKEDISYILNVASRYSPWQTETIAQGYITTRGGHRIGICGEAVVHGSVVQGIRNPDALCIRLARDVENIASVFRGLQKSILVLGPPCSGKTTLLRDIARTLAAEATVAVVDEREELFPEGFRRGKRMDVLRLCPKAAGIDMLLRTMGPDWICMDEITREADSRAILQAANCGVRLMASAHAFDLKDLKKRSIYRELLENDVFKNVVVLQKNKRFFWEMREVWE